MPPPVDRSKVAGTLLRLRAKREIGQSELARELGFSQAYISKLESGLVNYERLPLATITKLARGLGFTLEDWPGILQGIMPPRRAGHVQGTAQAEPAPEPPALDLPEGLLEAGERYAAIDPLIAHPQVQEMLARQGNFGGRGPVTAQEWWRYFESVRQYIEVEE